MGLGHFHQKQTGIQTPTPPVLENVVYYAQGDPKWKQDALGDSVYHMGDSGCLVTCLAAALQMQNIHRTALGDDINPKTLNQFFSAHQVYDAEGDLQWYAMEDALQVSTVYLESGNFSVETLENLWKETIYPIACVSGKHGNLHKTENP